MSSAIFYSVILVLLAVFAFYIAIKSFLKKEFFGTIFGLSCFFVFLTTYSYICSILFKEETVVRACVNIYFGSISVILALFLKKVYLRSRVQGFLLGYALQSTPNSNKDDSVNLHSYKE